MPTTNSLRYTDVTTEVSAITEMIVACFPELLYSAADSSRLRDLIWEAFESSDLDMDIEAAVKWGEGFSFPPPCFTNDIEDLDHHQGDLSSLIRSRQRAISHRRLNSSCISGLALLLPPDDPDLALLTSLVDGIPVIVDPLFTPDPNPPSPSPLYVTAACAVNKMWYSLYQKGFVLFFPTARLKTWHSLRQFQLSYSRAGWAKKRGAAKGRPTNNHSYDNKKGGLINTSDSKASLKDLYGEIHPAQLTDIVLTILVQAAKHGWDNIIMWKMDLMGAYNLLFSKRKTRGFSLWNSVTNSPWCQWWDILDGLAPLMLLML